MPAGKDKGTVSVGNGFRLFRKTNNFLLASLSRQSNRQFATLNATLAGQSRLGQPRPGGRTFSRPARTEARRQSTLAGECTKCQRLTRQSGGGWTRVYLQDTSVDQNSPSIPVNMRLDFCWWRRISTTRTLSRSANLCFVRLCLSPLVPQSMNSYDD